MSIATDFRKLVKSALIIQTNCYAGCFDRSMHSYCTGYVDEYYPGGCDELAESAQQAFTKQFDQEYDDELFSNLFAQPMGDYGQSVSVTIARDDTGNYNSVAMLFDNTPSEEILRFITQRAHQYAPIIDIDILNIVWEQYDTQINITSRFINKD